MLRKAGSPARGLMKEWVKMRRESEDVRRMLGYIEVYQQPSGFADGVIVSWITEGHAERVPQAIHQRDLFAGRIQLVGLAQVLVEEHRIKESERRVGPRQHGPAQPDQRSRRGFLQACASHLHRSALSAVE